MLYAIELNCIERVVVNREGEEGTTRNLDEAEPAQSVETKVIINGNRLRTCTACPAQH